MARPADLSRPRRFPSTVSSWRIRFCLTRLSISICASWARHGSGERLFAECGRWPAPRRSSATGLAPGDRSAARVARRPLPPPATCRGSAQRDRLDIEPGDDLGLTPGDRRAGLPRSSVEAALHQPRKLMHRKTKDRLLGSASTHGSSWLRRIVVTPQRAGRARARAGRRSIALPQPATGGRDDQANEQSVRDKGR
jgi:hypothetical protein